MDSDLKKVKKLISLMKKEKVLHLKQGALELSLSPDAFEETGSLGEKEPTLPPDKSVSLPISEETYTADDALYWSTTPLPEDFIQ